VVDHRSIGDSICFMGLVAHDGKIAALATGPSG